MLVLSSALLLLSAAQSSLAALTTSNLKKHVDVLTLENAFNPVEEAYWTGLPHHRRTPFAVSPDGKSAYLAYLDSSGTDVHVQPVNPSTFAATGTTVTVTGGKEAGGLVAHNDGFALLTNEAMPSSTSGDIPPSNTPVAVLYRYTSGKQTWKTWLGGPNVHADDGMGLSCSPDLNGDLVYSEEAGYYGAYFVVTDYSGDASGHYGDNLLYITPEGKLDTSVEGTSSWGCSHNTGIAFEAADATPYASVCATAEKYQGFLALNTGNGGMDTTVATKISNENVTNGATNEALGGMSGSYSGLARFGSSAKYILAWVSRGATDLTEYDWMGSGYVSSVNRTNPRHLAIAIMSDKKTLSGKAASSEVGAKSGDSQINWITPTSAANDCSNAHVATFGESNALLTWEEISNPQCNFISMGCAGTFAGTKFQEVDSTGATVGDAITVKDTYVAGDMVTMSDGRICWPYVSMTWDLSDTVAALGLSSKTTKKISFACMSGSSSTAGSSSASSSSAAAVASSGTTAAEAVATSAAAATPSVAATQTTLQTLISSSASAAQQDASGASTVAVTPVATTTPSESVAASAGSGDNWWYGSWPSAFPAQVQAQTGKTRAGKTCRRRKRGVAHAEA
ncbi:hypothetical protein IWZ01DRAFT_575167 [Phyllosticta capitalensis]